MLGNHQREREMGVCAWIEPTKIKKHIIALHADMDNIQ